MHISVIKSENTNISQQPSLYTYGFMYKQCVEEVQNT